MKKIFSALVALFLAGVLAAGFAPVGQAQGIQTPEPTPVVDPANLDTVSFATLDPADIVLNGPFDSARVQFAIPSTWLLQDGASLNLVISGSFTSTAQNQSEAQGSGASLEISMNGEVIDTLFINWTDPQTVALQIPAAVLMSPRVDGRHVLDFSLDASIDCRFPHETSIVIMANSAVYLPHVNVAPKTNLNLLPAPIYQRYAFQVEPALLVVPPQPTADEIKAAMIIAAGFGRMSSGELALPVFPYNSLTDEQKSNSHLVFVGKPSSLQVLGQVNFPVGLTQQGLSSPGSQPDDGYIQMAVSPWNSARVVLYAGGNTDIGVVKAAQAISSGKVQPGASPNLTVISQVDPTVTQISSVLEDSTFTSLGYPTQTISGYGSGSNDYTFFIQPGQTVGDGAYANLIYNHSALLDYNTSSLVVSLNGQQIGSGRFTEATAATTNTLKVDIPSELVRIGENRLTLDVQLMPVNYCSGAAGNTLWVSVSNLSSIHLSLIPAAVNLSNQLVSLTQYDVPFLSSPTLDSVGLILDPSNPVGWSIAAALVSELGRQSSGIVLNPEVAFSDSVSDDFLKDNDLIVIGRPSKIPLVASMADVMPAPFEANNDLALERNMAVTYRLPSGSSLGYIEMFNSPFNDSRVVLTVLGSTEEGLMWSGNALTISQLRRNLSGNYAVIHQDQILTTDTRIGSGPNLSATAVPGALPTIPSISEPPASEIQGQPNWIFPAIVTVSVLTLALVIGLMVFSKARNKVKK